MPPIDGFPDPADVAGSHTHSLAPPDDAPPPVPVVLEIATGVDGVSTAAGNACAGC